jgi:hypothetical protein
VTSTIQSVGSNTSVYDPSPHMSSAPPASASGAPPSASPPAVTQLVKQNPPAGAGNSCVAEGTALAAATANLLGSLGRVVVGAPTLIAEVPALLGFIAAAMQTGAAAANYANCKDRSGPVDM